MAIPVTCKTRRSEKPVTDRQLEIMLAAAGGLTEKEIARNFGISPKTVCKLKSEAYSRLNLQNLVDASIFAVLYRTSQAMPHPRSPQEIRKLGCDCRETHAQHCHRRRVISGQGGDWDGKCKCSCHET